MNTTSRKEQISNWYLELFPIVATFVSKKGGNLEDAKEVFQESIVIYYEKLRSDSFAPTQSDEAYLVGIAKKRWLKTCNNLKHHKQLDQIDVKEQKEAELLTGKLMEHLKRTGQKCMDLLQAFYYEKVTMKELASRFGYRSERSATVQKYKCIEKIREEVKQKSLAYEDFLA